MDEIKRNNIALMIYREQQKGNHFLPHNINPQSAFMHFRGEMQSKEVVPFLVTQFREIQVIASKIGISDEDLQEFINATINSIWETEHKKGKQGA